MTQIFFKCDRCGSGVDGIHTKGATAGFYVMDSTGWDKYALNDKEHFVCEECVQKMPEYKKDYNLG